MLRFSAPLRLTALFGLCAAVPAQVRVQILHASDLEGGVDAIADAPNFAAVVEALEAEAQLAGVPSLLLSAGDNVIPGPFFSASGDPSVRPVLRRSLRLPAGREGVGRFDIAIMNTLGFDASALGNHEFDAGTGVLAEFVRADIRDSNNDGILDEARWLGVQFPYLSANLDFSGESALASAFTSSILPSTAFRSTTQDLVAGAAAPKLAAATIIERGGERFGVIGATTPLLASISSPGGVAVGQPGAGTNDMAALANILQPTIDAVRNLGVDKIILVTHLQQLALELDLVGRLFGVDVIIAGGSDTLLADSTDRLRAGDVAGGPYPVLATNAAGEPALIVSTDGQYSYVGRLSVTFDANGVVVPASVDAAESGAFATDAQGVTDLWAGADPFASGTKGSVVAGLTGAVRQVVVVKDGNVFGSASVFLEGRRAQVRTQETNLGNLTADANLFVARQVDPNVRVSIKNGGGIRAEIGSIDGTTGALLPTTANPESGKLAGQISQLDIENSLRFNNTLTLLTLTRAQLKAVLEHAVAGVAPGATPGAFGQFGGIAFSFDPIMPVGQRVRTAGLIGATNDLPFFVLNGQVVGANPIRIVTLNFLANGGDNYPFPAFINADPVFANRVELTANNLPAGVATFAAPGSEQDALAEYLAAQHAVVPFNVADTAIGLDLRIQNLVERFDLVIGFVLRSVL